MKKGLVLLGGGGHCKSVLDAALRSGGFGRIVITDPILKQNSEILGCSVAGNDDMLPVLRENGFSYAFITVGSIENVGVRKKLQNLAEVLGFSFPVIADPSAKVSEFGQIGEGTFIGKNAVINAEAKIGKHCIINTGSIVEHECSVGDHTHVAVGAILCGNVSVGQESFIGAGSTLIQGVDIGSKVIIGAGSIVLSDVEQDMKVYGIVHPQKGACGVPQSGACRWRE